MKQLITFLCSFTLFWADSHSVYGQGASSSPTVDQSVYSAPADGVRSEKKKVPPSGLEEKYEKAVADILKKRWYDIVTRNMDDVQLGSVTIRFAIIKPGKIVNLRFVSGDEKSKLAKASLAAIHRTIVPPIPPDVITALNGKPLELSFDFKLY